MKMFIWLNLPTLLLIIQQMISVYGNMLNDNVPIKVNWTTMHSDPRSGVKVTFKDLHGSNVDGMFNHYKRLNNAEVKSSVKNGFFLTGSDIMLNDMNYRKNEVIKKFIHHTIDTVANNYIHNDCGITAENGSLILKYCPGLMTVITMDHIGTYSCASIKSLTVYGPVIIKAAECSEQILSKGDCNLALLNNYLDHDCHVIKKDSANTIFLITFLILSLLNIFMITAMILYAIRFKKIKRSYNSKLSFDGLELHNYSRFDSEFGTILTKEKSEQEDSQNLNKKKLSWLTILLILFCCKPVDVSSYELVDSQKVSDSLFKYTITMESSEVIKIDSKIIKLVNSDSTSRLIHMFTSYDWSVDFANKYYCLQEGCNEKLTCREDLLPFTRADQLIGDEIRKFRHRINYYTCKNMRNYCAFANGCFILAFTLILDEFKKYEIYKVSQQNRISRDVILPPGCYLDEYKPDRSSGVDEMYYVENRSGTGWFCHPTVYAHYPLPHSLGDVKVGPNFTINFITDFMNCATDKWRDVYCTKPASFLSRLDDYCVKNSKDDLGLNIERHGDSLSWPSDKLETIKISCDRDLELIQSDHHCTDIQIEVWDTGNTQSDLLMSVFAKSDSGVGVFILPNSVHAESHHFGCNSVWHNTFLYDIQSLNSSGLHFKYHTNIKPIINDDYIGEEVKPINEDHWYNLGLGMLFSSLREWFTGSSSLLFIGLFIVVLMILKR